LAFDRGSDPKPHAAVPDFGPAKELSHVKVDALSDLERSELANRVAVPQPVRFTVVQWQGVVVLGDRAYAIVMGHFGGGDVPCVQYRLRLILASGRWRLTDTQISSMNGEG
jgi:hypothetical protein